MYTALYRQWRPDTFEEVVGQEAIVRTLQNQIKGERIAHAYLFCGSRGTGKTSTAKIFSRAINCAAPVAAGPCGECPICLKLSAGNNMDIMEIDAASNNGVDEIRDLREKVRFPPAVGRYKVYIIDEVHMLSIGAFNALLKTLEEPPSHVVFILATTEPHKLPATILSRCQRFDFKRISLGVMVDRMRHICAQMGVSVDETGLYTIARWAEGGMRDALSLLDQAVGFCGTQITNQDIISVLGTADQGFIFETAEHIIGGDARSLLIKLDRLIDDGKDLTVYLKDLIHHLRNLLVVKLCDSPAQLLDAEASTIERLKEQAAAAGQSRLIRAIELLTTLEAELKWSTQPRVLFELAVVKICRPQQQDSMEDLIDRLDQIERQLAQGIAVKPQEPVVKITADEQQEPAANKAGADQEVNDADAQQAHERKSHLKEANLKEVASGTDETNANPSEQKTKDESGVSKDVVKAWPDILKAVKKERFPVYPLLNEAKPFWDGSATVILAFPPEQGFFAAAMEKEGNKTFLENLIARVTGRTLKIKCQLGGQLPDRQEAPKEDDIVQQAIEVFGRDVVQVAEEE